MLHHVGTGRAPQVGGDYHDDAVALPMGPGRLLAAGRNPDLDVLGEQGGGLGYRGHGVTLRLACDGDAGPTDGSGLLVRHVALAERGRCDLLGLLQRQLVGLRSQELPDGCPEDATDDREHDEHP
jgi:hypothetical protein